MLAAGARSLFTLLCPFWAYTLPSPKRHSTFGTATGGRRLRRVLGLDQDAGGPGPDRQVDRAHDPGALLSGTVSTHTMP